MTPEGRVKAAIDKVLENAPHCYKHKPVQNGMGAPTLDYVGCSNGRYFTIEAKAPGGKATARQLDTMAKVAAAGGKVFEIASVDGDDLHALEQWLHALDAGFE